MKASRLKNENRGGNGFPDTTLSFLFRTRDPQKLYGSYLTYVYVYYFSTCSAKVNFLASLDRMKMLKEQRGRRAAGDTYFWTNQIFDLNKSAVSSQKVWETI